MKILRYLLCILLVSLCSIAFAQSDAQKSFAAMKTLAGSWEGSVTTTPKMKEMGEGAATEVTLRVTSRGNAVLHQMKEAGKPEDPTKYDEPITMFYLDEGRLLLTHYCDAGNRPRMTGKASPDGKKVEFDFLDLS